MSQPLFTGQRNQIDPRGFLVRLGPAPRIGVVRARPAAAAAEYATVEIEVGANPVYILRAAGSAALTSGVGALHIMLASSTTLDGLSGASTAFSFGVGPALTATSREGRRTTQPSGMIVASENIATSGSSTIEYVPIDLPLYVASGFVALSTDLANTSTALSLTWAEVPT